MNDVLHPHLDSFVVVYLEDIVVYSDNMEYHKKHLALVFEALKKSRLYLKKSKCMFAQTEIPFLGHIMGQGHIRMEPSRVKAIEAWAESKNVHDMRVFLGMTNYQRKFVEGYYKVTLSLTDLLKKDKQWNWMEKCRMEFEELKKRMVSAPMLKLPDFERPFEVHTDALNFVIGGVLMQDGNPVAYESVKLQDREQSYPIHEKEMTAIIQCLQVWRHYLIGKPFVVKIYNVAMSYFES